MTAILISILLIILLFSLTIFVHELGHYLAARACGMIVEVFSIGFGPAIWKRTVGGITYKIGVIPFGGYVALPQMDPGGRSALEKDGSTKETKAHACPPVSPWKRIVVALAGATGNILLAILLAYLVYFNAQSFAPLNNTGTVGYVYKDSSAYAAGLRTGDAIVAINAQPIRDWEEFLYATAFAGMDTVTAAVKRAEAPIVSMPLPTQVLFGTRHIAGVMPVSLCWVLSVMPGSSAAQAGIVSGDKIMEVDGQPVYSREHLIELISARRDRAVTLRIDRRGKAITLPVSPVYDEKLQRAVIGVQFNSFDVQKPWSQIRSHASMVFRLLKALVTPKETKSAAGAVGGPVMILQMFWFYLQGGLIMALWFTGMLNVNLAILNLLPIPVLDGGHVIFSLWEAVTRRPPSEKVVGFMVNVFGILLISVFVLLTGRDILRAFHFHKSNKETPPVEQPAQTNQVAPATSPRPEELTP
jgi:regulator of sigma E protease